MGIWIAVFFGAALIGLAAWYGLRHWMIVLTDKRIAAFQSGLVEKYCEEVRNIYQDMRGWRHDYRNHIQMLKAYRSAGKLDKLDNYLSQLDRDLNSVDPLIKTGNVTMDAILNSKLSLAKSLNISVNAKVTAPTQLSVSEIDLCIIIGNLLDNATEACEKLSVENRYIRLYIDVKHAHLYIHLMNAVNGKPSKRNGIFLSDKTDGESGTPVKVHGFGLMRIDRIVAKYGGYLYRAAEEDAFTTEITLPV